MGKKRKAGSPLQQSQGGTGVEPDQRQIDLCAELKDFIVSENAKCVAAIQDTNERRIAAMEQSLSFTMDSISTLAARQQSADWDILQLRRETADMEARLQRLEMQEDRVQQEKRLTCLLFSGPAVLNHRREDAAELISALIHRHMQHEIDRAQVRAAFRLKSGKIMMDFYSAAPSSDRDVMFRSKSKLKGSGLYISESLTPRRQALFQSLLQLKKEKTIFSVFTRSGNVFACKTRDSAPIRVINEETVRQLSGARPPQQPEREHTQANGRVSFLVRSAEGPSRVRAMAELRTSPRLNPGTGDRDREGELRGTPGSRSGHSAEGGASAAVVSPDEVSEGGSRRTSSSLLDCAREPVRQVRLLPPLRAASTADVAAVPTGSGVTSVTGTLGRDHRQPPGVMQSTPRDSACSREADKDKESPAPAGDVTGDQSVATLSCESDGGDSPMQTGCEAAVPGISEGAIELASRRGGSQREVHTRRFGGNDEVPGTGASSQGGTRAKGPARGRGNGRVSELSPGSGPGEDRMSADVARSSKPSRGPSGGSRDIREFFC